MSWGAWQDKMLTETQKVRALIEEVGCHRLGHWDGCCCSSFSIRDVDVTISCGKGDLERGFWVSSQHAEYADVSRLYPILKEVQHQLVEEFGWDSDFTAHLGEAPQPEMARKHA